MGYLQHKYTKEYFTGLSSSGESVGYGNNGYDSFLEGKVRPIDLAILSQINYSNRNVLEFGFGRGEAIRYGVEHGAKSYVAVDFAESAVEITKEYLKEHGITLPTLYHSDALTFLENYVRKHSGDKKRKFDIVLMLDFIEHVPRLELRKIFCLLQRILSYKGLIAINTPNYKYDNDVIKEGLNKKNNLDTVDTSDLVDATKGMHCNKYTTVSLKEFMENEGYLNVTEYHFYISQNKNVISNAISYRQRWDKLFKYKYPIFKAYKDDVIENAYIVKESLNLIPFTEGHLRNINLYVAKSYAASVYAHGYHDKEMFEDIKTYKHRNNIIFDVGGFIGTNSLLFSKYLGKKSKIITFEPNPYNFNRMLLNYSNNTKYSTNIFAYELALGDYKGTDDFLLSNSIDNGYSSTSRLRSTHTEYTQEQLLDMGFFYHKIHIQTLDSFVLETGLKPNIIKVDVEGAEHLFLLGAKKLLTTSSPILYIELHSQYCAVLCTKYLAALGYDYKILKEEEDKRILVKYYKPLNTTKIKNGRNVQVLEDLQDSIYINTIKNLKQRISILEHNHAIINNKQPQTNIRNTFIEAIKLLLFRTNNKLKKTLIKFSRLTIK